MNKIFIMKARQHFTNKKDAVLPIKEYKKNKENWDNLKKEGYIGLRVYDDCFHIWQKSKLLYFKN